MFGLSQPTGGLEGQICSLVYEATNWRPPGADTLSLRWPEWSLAYGLCICLQRRIFAWAFVDIYTVLDVWQVYVRVYETICTI